MAWGHRFLTSSLVFSDGQDPYRLRADAAPSLRMASEHYPYLTPSEARLNLVGDVLVSGYELKGVLVDADASKLTLRSLPHFPAGIIGRFRSNPKVGYQDQKRQAKELAAHFRPGRARYDRQLGCYAKRVTTLRSDVGQVDLSFIWYANNFGWKLSSLVSTLPAGVQEIIRAVKARWGLETMHRTLRQNLALAKCQCLSLIAPLRPFDFCISALHLIRLERQQNASLSLKQAQKLAARRAQNALLTKLNQIAA